MSESIEVRLLALPVDVHVRTATHLDALNREFELIRRAAPEARSAPHRLQALVDRLHADFGGVADEPTAELQAAIERGDARIDLTYRVPENLGTAVQALGDILEEVDDYCRAGDHLLSLVTPEESLRYRRWFLGEFVRQVAGEPPSPWPTRVDWHPALSTRSGAGGGPVAAPLPDGWSVDEAGDHVTVHVTGPLDLESAPALRSVALGLVRPDRGLAIDLTASAFVDSVGLSVLIAIHLRAGEEGGAVSFAVGPAARSVMAAAGLLDVLDVDEAASADG